MKVLAIGMEQRVTSIHVDVFVWSFSRVGEPSFMHVSEKSVMVSIMYLAL